MKIQDTRYITEGTAALDSIGQNTYQQEHIISFPTQQTLHPAKKRPSIKRAAKNIEVRVANTNTVQDLKFGQVRGTSPSLFTRRQAILAGFVMILITFSTLFFL